MQFSFGDSSVHLEKELGSTSGVERGQSSLSPNTEETQGGGSSPFCVSVLPDLHHCPTYSVLLHKMERCFQNLPGWNVALTWATNVVGWNGLVGRPGWNSWPLLGWCRPGASVFPSAQWGMTSYSPLIPGMEPGTQCGAGMYGGNEWAPTSQGHDEDSGRPWREPGCVPRRCQGWLQNDRRAVTRATGVTPAGLEGRHHA